MWNFAPQMNFLAEPWWQGVDSSWLNLSAKVVITIALALSRQPSAAQTQKQLGDGWLRLRAASLFLGLTDK